MASATSLLDRTDMYNMVAQEGISNPETDTGLPTLQEIVEPGKLSRPIYLGDKAITAVDTIKTGILVICLVAALALLVFRAHKWLWFGGW